MIKKPIDMQKIQQRLASKQYEQLDDMTNDFLLMFDNACKFNEPDSLIYKVLRVKRATYILTVCKMGLRSGCDLLVIKLILLIERKIY